MKNQEVMVVYNWTAKEGQSETLKGIYREVTQQMKDNEPGAKHVECYFDDASGFLNFIDLT